MSCVRMDEHVKEEPGPGWNIITENIPPQYTNVHKHSSVQTLKCCIVIVVVSFISNRIQQWNTTREKHIVDIRKHIETLLHLSVVTREVAVLIKLATKTYNKI